MKFWLKITFLVVLDSVYLPTLYAVNTTFQALFVCTAVSFHETFAYELFKKKKKKKKKGTRVSTVYERESPKKQP